MNLQKLQAAFSGFKKWLTGPEAAVRLHLWESQAHFQQHWDLGATDGAAMYDRSLQNSRTRRLWKREQFEPKRVMLLFWQQFPDFTRQAFRDLFDESKAVDSRMDRFVFYCDQLLEQYRESKPHSIENNHYHNNDHRMSSVYLAFRYPEQYTLYDFDLFIASLQQLGVANLPKANELERFFKVSRTIFKLMSRDEELFELHENRLQKNLHYGGTSLLLVYDFCCWLSGLKLE